MKKIRELIDKLNYYTEKYNLGYPEIPDRDWDNLYFELVKLESLYELYYPDSPTQRIYYKELSSLNKVKHNHLMLSLDKTKEIGDILEFLGSHDYLAMLKMDGLTCSLSYEKGKLVSAETRGNGEVGEDIFHNAIVIPSIPKKIDYQEDLTVDGEIICTYHDFEPFKKEYKNPRNYAAGSIRLLNSEDCASRSLTFVAWEVIYGMEDIDSLGKRLNKLKELGFRSVPFRLGSKTSDKKKNVLYLQERAEELAYPIDGIVFKIDSKESSKKLGRTDHHFKNALAFKFFDKLYESRLKEINWSMSRNGTLTPVAVFEPIDIEGSIITRASLHNLDIMEKILDRPYFDQRIWVSKRNMIIPQIERAEKRLWGETATDIGSLIPWPKKCPYCLNNDIKVSVIENTRVLKCFNPSCSGKLINKIDHYCSKNAMDIKGLSKATLSKFIDANFINKIEDIYYLHNHKKDLIQIPGFGEKSISKILNAIESSKKCTLAQFITAIGIPEIGANTAKILSNKFTNWKAFRIAVDDIKYSFNEIEGFGNLMNLCIKKFDYTEADQLFKYLTINNIQSEEKSIEQSLNGIKVSITGKLTTFKNRDELIKEIEKRGGSFVSSVSKKTNFLVNNDFNSNSAKNISARELNIPILTEQEFIKKFLT